MTNWIDRDEALHRLKVKPQTLYAYVSRGRIRMEPDPADMRRSLYAAEDIAEVATRKARGRKPATIAASSMDWGEPAIPTSLSTAQKGKLYYRGLDAVELARHATLEDIAALLWDTAETPNFGTCEETYADAFHALTACIAGSPSILGRNNQALAREAELAIGALAQTCGAVPGNASLHHRLAEGWRCDPGAENLIRQALVLMADHDLNASTFAARVAASTGASLAACLMAGLCTLSGPRHGGASEALVAFVDDARRLGAPEAVRHWLSRDRMLPGFGHNLYPDGDPRATLLLEGFEAGAELRALAQAVFEMTGLSPNCDFGLAVLVDHHHLPSHAPFSLFLLGRSVGWCAHVMEQNMSGSLIRPRGRYEGRELQIGG